jgi:hypothetical protein
MAGKFISTNSSENKYHIINSIIGKIQRRPPQLCSTVILTLFDAMFPLPLRSRNTDDAFIDEIETCSIN